MCVCVVSNMLLRDKASKLVCVCIGICFWVSTHRSVLCMVVRVTSKPLVSPHVLCPCCHPEGDWEPVKAMLMEWWMQRLIPLEMKGGIAPLKRGCTPFLPQGRVRASTFCDHCISASLKHLALVSNTFYSSHVVLLIPFSKFLKRDYYALSIQLGKGSKRNTNSLHHRHTESIKT